MFVRTRRAAVCPLRLCTVEIIEGRLVFMLAVVGHILVTLQTDQHITAEDQRRVDEDTANIQKHLQARSLGGAQCDPEAGQKRRKKMLGEEKDRRIERKADLLFA